MSKDINEEYPLKNDKWGKVPGTKWDETSRKTGIRMCFNCCTNFCPEHFTQIFCEECRAVSGEPSLAETMPRPKLRKTGGEK